MAKRKKRNYIIAAVVAAVIVLVIIVLIVKPFSNNSSEQTFSQTANQNTKGVPTTSSQSTNGSQTGSNTISGSEPGDNKSSSSNASSVDLLSPTGNFVSAHHVNSNSPINSVCNTTSGASCLISFTNTSSGVTYQLPSQTTDRGGSTYWSGWTPEQYGISPGTWKIQAVASLSGQSKTASDATNLVVSQ